MLTANPELKRGHAPIIMNQGQALKHLADKYPGLFLVVLEIIQNALDKGAKNIWVRIDYLKRVLAVCDNGNGTNVDEFNSALASVATPGRKGFGSLGRFALGLISPIGKCERFVFTSCPVIERSKYREWVFDCESIINCSGQVSIPWNSRDDLVFQPSMVPGKTQVPWRSKMLLENFSSDEIISRIDMNELVAGIQDRFSSVMRKNGTVVSIEIVGKDGQSIRRPNITALEYRGQPLPVFETRKDGVGKVRLELFIARMEKGGRKGRVNVGIVGDAYTFPFHLFVRSHGDRLDKEILDAINSGLFEGEIRGEKLNLRSERKSFEDDMALLDFCVAIDDWWLECGKSHAENAKRQKQEQRFQDLGVRSMRLLEHLLKDPAHKTLMDVIGKFKLGSVGDEHFPPRPTQVVRIQDLKSLTVTDGKIAPKDGGGTRAPDKEHKGHKPFTVIGPRGQHRKVVRSNSLGLQFAHEPMTGSRELYKFYIDEGLLVFNTTHPLFVACDEKGDSALMKLHEFIAIQALTLEAMPETHRIAQKQVLDQLNYAVVSWFTISPKLRDPGSKKTE